MSEPVIKIRDLKKTYLMGTMKVNALNGVSFDIHPNDYIAIMGPSGSGKSTLMNMIGCLEDARKAGLMQGDGKTIENVFHSVPIPSASYT